MIISTQAAFGFLLLNGMPRNRCTEFVAIAICESSLDTQSVSPAGALGLWQIMPFNFAPYGLSASDWANPDTNARAAVMLSGNGANCAAWDTCYRDINATGRYRFLNWPEAGSCAANNLGTTSVAVGSDKSGGASPPAQPGVSDTLSPALAQYSSMAAHDLPQARRRSDQYGAVLGRMFTKGWRP